MRSLQKKIFLINLIFFLCVFNYLHFLPFIKAESQPLAILPSIFILLLYRNKNQLQILLYFLYLTVALVISFLILYHSVPFDFVPTITSYIVLLTPFIIFSACLRDIHLVSIKLYRFILFLWIYVGLAQYLLLPIMLQIVGLEFLFNALIPSFDSYKTLGLMGRGVNLISPEPSHSAHVIFVFLCFSIYNFKLKKIGKIEGYVHIVLISFLIIINESATVGLTIILLIALAIILDIKKLILAIPVLSLLLFLLPMLDLRFVQKLSLIVELIISGNFSFLEFAQSVGGRREISVYVGLMSILDGNILGHGLGGYKYFFQDQAQRLGVNLNDFWYYQQYSGSQTKPNSYLSFLVFELGLFGMVYFLMLFISIIYKFKPFYKANKLGIAIVLISVIKIFFHNPQISLPLYWLSLAIGLQLISEKRVQLSKYDIYRRTLS